MYQCESCEYTIDFWVSRCRSCNKMNTLKAVDAEEDEWREQTPPVPVNITEVESEQEARFSSGEPGLDWVLGGGVVPGSVIAVGGEPGIGKSTIVMQMASRVGEKVLYVSGEETIFQTSLRAQRLGCATANISLICESEIERVLGAAELFEPEILVVDSIQTVRSLVSESMAGSVVQIRECTGLLVDYAKSSDVSVFVVSHVNKDGDMAGPKTMQHMVDTVLHFEQRSDVLRLLKSSKNRFGSIVNQAMFEMGDSGLTLVDTGSSV